MGTLVATTLGTSLAQALRYVNAWKSKTVVVKYGGSLMSPEDDSPTGDTLIEDLVLLKGTGVDPVLIHGGGPEITRMLDRLGKRSRFVNGLRVTDEETMDIVEMVLAGRANKALVSMIAAAGGSAVGVSGKDGNVFQARKLPGPEDLGQVGEIDAVDPTLIKLLSGNGYIPVVASIGIGADGRSFNLVHLVDRRPGRAGRRGGGRGALDSPGEGCAAPHPRGRDRPRNDPQSRGLSRRIGRRGSHRAHHRRSDSPRPPRRTVHPGRRGDDDDAVAEVGDHEVRRAVWICRPLPSSATSI